MGVMAVPASEGEMGQSGEEQPRSEPGLQTLGGSLYYLRVLPLPV